MRKLAAVLLAVTVCFGLGACHKGKYEPAPVYKGGS